jgi:hypothetical protein
LIVQFDVNFKLENVMKRRTKIIAIWLGIILYVCGWGRVLWIAQTKISPPRICEYDTMNGKTWSDPGFPHVQPPYLIEQDAVWAFGSYNTASFIKDDPRAKTSGMIRFDLRKGIAQMLWPFPGESRHASILGVAKRADGDIAVLWLPNLGHPRVDLLLSGGGMRQLAQLNHIKSRLDIKGMSWVQGQLELVVGFGGHEALQIYRLDHKGHWQTRPISWPKQALRADWILLATHNAQGWMLYALRRHNKLKHHPPTSTEPTHKQSLIYAFDERGSSFTSHGLFDIPRNELLQWLDQTPGNLISYSGRLALRDHKLVSVTPGALATQYQAINSQWGHKRYLLLENRLEWIIEWQQPKTLTSVWQYPAEEYTTLYRPTNRARRVRTALYLSSNQRESLEPIVESFRFRPHITLVPSADQSFWLLGTFGYYVKIDKALNRLDPLSFWERFVRIYQMFGSRQAQYDDFLFDLPQLKRLILPLLLFALPLLLILGMALYRISLRLRPNTTKPHSLIDDSLHALLSITPTQPNTTKPHSLIDDLWIGSMLYIILFLGSSYWFYLIALEF